VSTEPGAAHADAFAGKADVEKAKKAFEQQLKKPRFGFYRGPLA
jgi:hypothetical protein